MSPVHHFDRIQHLVMRTGWAPDDLHVTFQCTPFEPEVHAHAQADRLNVTMYALGERFVVDSGYGTVPIPGSTQVQRMGKLGESHNQVRIDAKAQAIRPVQEGVPGYSKVEHWAQSGDWVWAVADATAFYEGAARVRRGIATRLSADRPLMILVDLVLPGPGGHAFDWLLQTDEGNRLRTEADGAVIEGHRKGARARVIQAASTEVTWRQDTWIGHPRLIGASEGPYLVALTAVGAFDGATRREADGRLGLRLGSDEGAVEAAVTWAPDAPGPDSVSVHIGPDGVRFQV